MVTGPDGTMYVIDRHTATDPVQLWGDSQHGSIYRLTWDGVEGDPALPPRSSDGWSKIVKLVDDELLKVLGSESFHERVIAQHEIIHRGNKHRTALLKVLGDNDQPVAARLAALGAL